MGDIALHGPELKKFVKLAKKRDLNFAYCPGNDPKEDIFVLDRKKKPDVIGRAARGEGTGTKAAIGTARVKGRIMMLTCLKEVPQAAKKLKKFLKLEKVPMNIIIMDKDGNVIEEDIEELPEDPEWDADDANDDDLDDNNKVTDASNEEDSGNNVDTQRLNELKARAAKLQTGVAALSDPYKASMAKGFKPLVGLLQAGNLASADKLLTKLEKALVKMPGADNNAEPPADANAAADLGPLRQEAEALKQRIEGMGNADGVQRLLAAHGVLINQIEAGDVKKATKTAKALTEALGRVENETDDQNDQVQENEQQENPADDANALDVAWRDARADLEPVALDLLQRNLGDVSKMRAVLGFFIEKGEAGDFAGGMKAAPGLRKLIADAQAAEQTAAEQDIPAGVVPFVRARLDWIKTRGTLTAEMTKLQDAIVAACDAAEFPNISNDAKRLFTYLERLDGRLEDALEALVQEPDGDKREKLKADAARILAEYQAELNTDFFQAVDGNNGFKPVKVRSAAIASLGKVRSALSDAA
ncbi:MAG: hypothetical protein AAFY75_11605 [Pseudomonadota bacterium]